MTAVIHRPRFKQNKPRLAAIVDRDRAVAREAFRRGLALGAHLAAQRSRGPVLIMPARASEASRKLERRLSRPGPSDQQLQIGAPDEHPGAWERLPPAARHLAVAAAMAPIAAFIVFVLHL